VNEGQWSNVNGPLALTGSAIGGGSGSFFNIFNSFAWSGGNLSGDWGEISVRSGATMTISTATDKQIANYKLVNAGTVIWSAGNLNIGGGFAGTHYTIISSSGLFDIQGDVTLGYISNGVIHFTNTGTVRKSAGSGAASLGPSHSSLNFNNNGTVEVQSGALQLANGTSAGVFNVSTGATLEFIGGSHVLHTSATFNGPGLTRVAGGTLGVDEGHSATANGPLEFSAGTISGAGALTVNSQMTWTDGQMYYNYDNGGPLTIAAGATLTISGAADKRIVGYRLVNAGTTIWKEGNLNIGGGWGGTHYTIISSSGLFDIQDDATLGYVSNGVIHFANTGTLRKSAGSGATVFAFGGFFDNSGTVDAQTGVLQFTTTSYVQTAGATRLTGGSLTSTPAVSLQGGILAGAGTVTGNVDNTAATVTPGLSPAIIGIAGDYTQAAAAALTIELGGLTPGAEHDQLSVTGAAALNGTLNASLIGGFTPSAGDAFTVLLCGSRSGVFATTNLPALPAGLYWDTVYGATSVVLRVLASATATPTPTATPTAT
jgi:hypothetical protein